MNRKRTLSAGAATLCVALLGALMVATSARSGTGSETEPEPTTVSGLDESCVREFDRVRIYLDPCIPDGEPFPADIQSAIDDVRRTRDCRSPDPSPASPSASALAREASAIEASSEPTATPDPTTTSAHFQSDNSVDRPCGNTSSDPKRGLKGNDGNMSFVGRYFDMPRAPLPDIAEYYNFARTGVSSLPNAWRRLPMCGSASISSPGTTLSRNGQDPRNFAEVVVSQPF